MQFIVWKLLNLSAKYSESEANLSQWLVDDDLNLLINKQLWLLKMYLVPLSVIVCSLQNFLYLCCAPVTNNAPQMCQCGPDNEGMIFRCQELAIQIRWNHTEKWRLPPWKNRSGSKQDMPPLTHFGSLYVESEKVWTGKRVERTTRKQMKPWWLLWKKVLTSKV